jgi:outer membrane protein TolC
MRPITQTLLYCACCARGAAIASLGLLGACATYSPLPLNRNAALAVRIEPADPQSRPSARRLTLDDITMLALRNNPDLVAARQQRGVAQAQVLSAGILPNPVVSGSYGFLLGGPGTTGALAAGVSQDLKSLVTLSSSRAAATHAARGIDAQLLWQEWQTIAKVRLLVVDLMEGEQLRRLIEENATQLQELLSRNRDALAQGDTTLTALVPDLSAQASVRRQQDDLERLQSARRRDLNVLLGLAPFVVLPLSETLDVPSVDTRLIEQQLADLADRRPDLIALQLGYQSQEDKVRGAILAQFPLLSLGVSGGHDNSNIRTFGPQITLELPLFNRNQGNIALARATRSQLYAEFSARLANSRAEVQSLLAAIELLQRQLALKQPQLTELDQIVGRARDPYKDGDLDERTFVDLLTARNAKQQEILAIEQTLLEQQIAVATLTGAGLPPVTLSAETH